MAELERLIIKFDADFQGLNKSFDQITQNSETTINAVEGQLSRLNSESFNQVKKTAGGIGNALSSSITGAVRTGKFELRDLAADMANIFVNLGSNLLTQSSNNIFNGLLGSLNFGGGGLLSSLFGGFFASGGIAPAGKFAVVGEQGPELLIPKQTSTIVSNGQANSLLGSLGSQPQGQAAVHISINTIDSQGVEQFFSRPESQRMVANFAVNAVQSNANKNLRRSPFE